MAVNEWLVVRDGFVVECLNQGNLKLCQLTTQLRSNGTLVKL